MSDEIFPDLPSDRPQDQAGQSSGGLVPVNSSLQDYSTVSPEDLEKQRLEGLAQEILELKLVFLSDAENFGREVAQLRGQLHWLTGLLVVAIVSIGGILTWLALSLTAEQAQLTRQVEAIATDAVEVERIDRLETQLNDLQDQLPDNIVRDVEANQVQLEALEEQISELSNSVATRRRTIAILAGALQDLINEEAEISEVPIPSAELDAELETELNEVEPSSELE